MRYFVRSADPPRCFSGCCDRFQKSFGKTALVAGVESGAEIIRIRGDYTEITPRKSKKHGWWIDRNLTLKNDAGPSWWLCFSRMTPYDHHSPAETQVKPDLVLPDHLRNSEGGLNWIMGRECYNLPLPVVTSWLVVWNIFVIFPNSWDDDPIWLILIFQGGRNHQLASQ